MSRNRVPQKLKTSRSLPLYKISKERAEHLTRGHAKILAFIDRGIRLTERRVVPKANTLVSAVRNAIFNH